MTLTREFTGERDPVSGQPRFKYVEDDPEGVVLITGPATGPMATSDGTEYDVTPDVIAVDSLEHAHELSHQIGVFHEEFGHPAHSDSEPFLHLCTSQCGVFKRADDHPLQRIALERAHEQMANSDPNEHDRRYAELGISKPKGGRR